MRVTKAVLQADLASEQEIRKLERQDADELRRLVGLLMAGARLQHGEGRPQEYVVRERGGWSVHTRAVVVPQWGETLPEALRKATEVRMADALEREVAT